MKAFLLILWKSFARSWFIGPGAQTEYICIFSSHVDAKCALCLVCRCFFVPLLTRRSKFFFLVAAVPLCSIVLVPSAPEDTVSEVCLRLRKSAPLQCGGMVNRAIGKCSPAMW